MFAIALTRLSTTAGKAIAKWSAIGLLVAGMFWKVYASGEAAQKAKELARDMDAAKEREKIDDNVRKMDNGAVDAELTRWVRKP